MNYLVILEKDFPKGSDVEDMKNRMRIPVRGVIVYIPYHTINWILFGQLYTGSTITLELDHRMTTIPNQWPQIACILNDNGDPS